MGPPGGLMFVSVGVLTFLQAIPSTFFAVFGCAVFTCYADFPMDIDAKHRSNYLLYLTYFKGKCDAHPDGGHVVGEWAAETDAANRTFYFLVVYGVANFIWIFTSAFLLLTGVRRLKGVKEGAKLCYPWIINTAALLALDVTGGIWYAIDISRTLTPKDYQQFVVKEAGPLPVQLDDVTHLPSIVMTLIFFRGVVLLVLNVVFCYAIIHAVGATNETLNLHFESSPRSSDTFSSPPIPRVHVYSSLSPVEYERLRPGFYDRHKRESRKSNESEVPSHHDLSSALIHHGTPAQQPPSTSFHQHEVTSRSLEQNLVEPVISLRQTTNHFQNCNNSRQQNNQRVGRSSSLNHLHLQCRSGQQVRRPSGYLRPYPAATYIPRPELFMPSDSAAPVSWRHSSFPMESASSVDLHGEGPSRNCLGKDAGASDVSFSEFSTRNMGANPSLRKENVGGERFLEPSLVNPEYRISPRTSSRSTDTSYVVEADRRVGQYWIVVNGKLRPHDYPSNRHQSEFYQSQRPMANLASNGLVSDNHNAAAERARVVRTENWYRRERECCCGEHMCQVNLRGYQRNQSSPTHDSIEKCAEELRQMQEAAHARAQRASNSHHMRNQVLTKNMLQKLREEYVPPQCQATPTPDYTPPGSPSLGLNRNASTQEDVSSSREARIAITRLFSNSPTTESGSPGVYSLPHFNSNDSEKTLLSQRVTENPNSSSPPLLVIPRVRSVPSCSTPSSHSSTLRSEFITASSSINSSTITPGSSPSSQFYSPLDNYENPSPDDADAFSGEYSDV